ncbi:MULTISPECIES: GIY-YIG nuclease family protein [Vibrionaceae]|uniref:GIY-YIG nuclease family protein n=1 Tax=Vibrionaceae TaxID=641 RepID=UPI0005E76F83|nr:MULTISPECIES: GIY-YIG nuclease family protein [Vibrionaceae]KJG01042.1 hypothetical protein UB35_14590 [Photobacterium angustum]PSV69425.1 hypothetical protein CTM95_00045 [Photobacterium angustum]UTZ24155.1 GIY-YIG nuclease family protein [Vibrio campbellii]
MKFLEIIENVRGNHPEINDNFISAGNLLDLCELPNQAGVYVLYSERQQFPYPWEFSGVFYIGKADNLNTRVIETHKKHTLAAKNNQRKGNSLYYPVYEYGASYGVSCIYCLCENPKELEGELLARFATVNGAIPVANRKHDAFWYLFPEL